LEALRKELDGLIGHDPLAAEKQLVDRLLTALRAPVAFADLSEDRLDALAAGVQACRRDLIALSDMLGRSFFTHIKVAQSVVFAARAGDDPADAASRAAS
jgi:hypothetical protein